MRKKINIVHLIPSLGIGGAEKILLDLYKNIDRERFSVKIVYWEDRQEILKNTGFSAKEIIRLELDKVVSLKSILTIARLLKKVQADIIQTHLMDADLLGFLASRIVKIPILITIHSYPFPIAYRHCFRYRMMSFFMCKFICVSNTVKNYLSSRAGINSDKIIVVHNGINFKEFSKNNDKLDKRRIRKSLNIGVHQTVVGNVSRLIKDKGHKYLLMAAPQILKVYPDTIFLVVGDGELKAELAQLCNELHISNNVIFTGARADVLDLLDIMDIFVFPTFNEAFGISVLEAMAKGKPIIATDDAAIPEIINDEKEGILIKPGDHIILGERVLNLIDNPIRCKNLGEAAREKIKLFSLENMIAKMESVYSGIVK